MILADKIIMLRKKNGWSQEELAEKMKVFRQSVSKWESALSVPDLDKVLQLSGFFGVSTDYLLKDELGEDEYSCDVQETAEPTVRRVTLQQANDFLAIKAVAAKRIALAVFICIISPITLLVLGAASEQPGSAISENMAGGIGLITLLLLVAGAVAVFISCGMKSEPYNFLDTETIETEYGVSGLVKDRMEKYRDTYVKSIIIGTCSCILSAVPLLTAAFLTENDLYLVLSLALTMIIAGIGTVFFVVSGINHASMQKLLQEGEYSRKSKSKNRYAEAIGTVYWLLAVALYLGYSFYTGNWKESWIIWPVAGVLFAVVSTICDLFVKSDK